MKKDNGKPEILAPVGSWQCFWAALDNGADSFYAGLKSLNARDLAPNFDINEMSSLVETAHKYKKKVYVTLNSLVKEGEIKDLVHILCALNHIKPDGLIIQDLSVLYLCKRFFPDLELHASTLMGFHNSIGVASARDLGFKRVVLARELTLEEIKACCQVKDIEIELFVAGALCFSISGFCLMSSFLGGKSSMRGKCVQPCRRRYSVKNSFGYFFSMKDLCLIDFVPQLTEIGVKAFKIEGRLRPAHYVASMVKAFRIAIDDFSKLDEAKKIANSACGRPHTTAYIKNPHPEDAIEPSIAPNTGLYVGKILDVLEDKILLEEGFNLNVGDKIRLVDKRHDIQESFSISKIEQNDTNKMLLHLDSKNKDIAKIERLFKKGILVFRISGFYKPDIRDKVFKKVSFSSIIREKETILEQIKITPKNKKNLKKRSKKQNILKIRTVKQLSTIRIKPDLIFLEIQDNLNSTIKTFNYIKRRGSILNTVWFLPVFIPEKEIKGFKHSLEWLFKKGCRNFGISNLGHLYLLKSLSRKIVIYGGYQLNMANSLAIRALSHLGVKSLEFSIETDQSNLSLVLKNIPQGIKIYQNVFGLIPLFTSRMRHLNNVEYYPIVSPKNERFFLIKDKFLEYVVPEFPLNLLKETKNDHKISGSVFDIRFQTPKFISMIKNKRDLKNIKGYRFNFTRTWR